MGKNTTLENKVIKKIKCDNVNYRKGYIEVSSDIHKGYLNIEAWNIHPDVDISDNLSFDQVDDEAFTGNIEIELNLENAKELFDELEKFLAKKRNGEL